MFSCRTTVPVSDSSIGTIKELRNSLEQNGILHLSTKVYNLNGANLKVKGKLIIDGTAKIVNGTLIGDQALIESPNKGCFEKIVIKGSWNNRTGYMKWFTDGKDSRVNYLALTNLVTMGVAIQLDDIYSLTVTANNSFDSNNDLVIIGKDSKTCGFILETKHRRGHAYFRSAKGNNIHLENISIYTRDYLNGELPKGRDYFFADCTYSTLFPDARPDMSYFKILNCELKGAIYFHYKANTENCNLEEFANLGIDDIQIKDCLIEHPVSLLSLTNAPYKKVEISNNVINDIYGPVFFFPISGVKPSYYQLLTSSGRPYMKIERNRVENAQAHQGRSKGYMALVVAKGNDFDVINNTFRNILNTKDGIETVPFYCSATNHLIVKGNKVLNCGSKGLGIGGGANCLLKLKRALNCDITDNEFRFDKTALVALGLIGSSKKALSSVKPAQFRFSLIGTDKRGLDSTHYYRIENNIFEAAIISDYSWISRANFTLKGNQIIINHMLTSDPDRWGGNLDRLDHTLLNFSTPITNGNIVIEKNEIWINGMDSNMFYFTRNRNDNKQYVKVLYQNNIFNIDGIVSLFYPRSDFLNCENELKGKGSFVYNEAFTLKKNRTIKRLQSTQKVDKYLASSSSAFQLKNYGSSKIIALDNQDTIATVVQVFMNDLYYYNDVDELPILLNVSANLITEKNEKIVLYYNIIFDSDSQAYFIEENSRKLIGVIPFWKEKNRQFKYDILSVGPQRETSIKLSLVSQTERWRSSHYYGFVLLRGLNDIKSFDITASVNKLSIPPNTNKQKYMRGIVTEN
jgi:hypothetical protein